MSEHTCAFRLLQILIRIRQKTIAFVFPICPLRWRDILKIEDFTESLEEYGNFHFHFCRLNGEFSQRQADRDFVYVGVHLNAYIYQINFPKLSKLRKS